MAEAVVVAREQQSCAYLLPQHLLHELPRREVGHLPVEAQHHQAVDARLGQQRLLLVQRGEQSRLPVGLQHLPRMAVEGHGHAPQSALPGPAAQLLQQIAVSAVHAVEETDGHGAVSRGQRLVRQIYCFHLRAKVLHIFHFLPKKFG